jgi:hypothetical protein
MPVEARRLGRAAAGAVALLFALGCSAACPEPFGKQHVLLFVTPLGNLTDGGQMEITIPQHYGGGDKSHKCTTWDFDFENTQIEVTPQGSLTVVTAERVPTTDLSWKAGGYRVVLECHLPGGADAASDMITVRVVRDGQALYTDSWVQPCKRS